MTYSTVTSRVVLGVGGTHHSCLGLGIVHVGVEQHSCVIVRCLQGNGQSIAAVLQQGERHTEKQKEGSRVIDRQDKE